jgi:hypothetical protein
LYNFKKNQPMKRILFACFLLTASCTVLSIQHAAAQTTPVTQASFTVKVNLLDSYITSGNMTAAQATWEDVHQMMISVLSATKADIAGATTPANATYYQGVEHNQRTIYAAIWALHTDLTLNQVAIHTQLQAFDVTIL